jgi:hypothetical protein
VHQPRAEDGANRPVTWRTKHFVLDANTVVHYVDVEVAPSNIGDVFCPTVNLSPIALLEFSAHHESYLGRKKLVSFLVFGSCESLKNSWSLHLSIFILVHLWIVMAQIEQPERSF